MYPYDEYDENKEVSSDDEQETFSGSSNDLNEPEILSEASNDLDEPEVEQPAATIEADDEQEEQIDGEYHLKRPESEFKYYTDANFTPESEATEPLRYYVPEEKQKKPKQEKRSKKSGNFSFAKIASFCMVCALLGGVAGGAVGFGFGSKTNEEPAQITDGTGALDTTSSPLPLSLQSTGDAISAKEIYALGCEQTVGISTEITTRNVFGMVSSGSVTGSGFIISEDGYIMTNYHVIESAYTGGYDVNVMLFSGESYVADIVGFDEENDIALLKIEASGLSAVTFSDSDELSVGDTVYAIGNPLGELAYTMTSGIISATDRVINTDENTSLNMFQMDAAVNSGNSGGPVYNSSGQVVGVVTAKYSDTGVEGLSFAIPINDAVNIATDIMENGYVTGKGYLGVNGQTIDSMTSQYYNMPQGVYVNYVEAGSCADDAGIKLYDIIIQVDSKAITTRDELSSAVKSCSAGDEVDVIVWRSGEYLTLTVTMDEYVPQTETSDQSSQSQNQVPGGYSEGQIGNNGTYYGN